MSQCRWFLSPPPPPPPMLLSGFQLLEVINQGSPPSRWIGRMLYCPNVQWPSKFEHSSQPEWKEVVPSLIEYIRFFSSFHTGENTYKNSVITEWYWGLHCYCTQLSIVSFFSFFLFSLFMFIFTFSSLGYLDTSKCMYVSLQLHCSWSRNISRKENDWLF